MSFKNINFQDARPVPDFEKDSAKAASGAASDYKFPLNKNAIAGFILAVVYALAGPLGTYYLIYDGRRNEALLVFLTVTSYVSFLGGLILSFRGMSECKHQCFKGRGYGIAGFATTLVTLGIVVNMLFVLSFSNSMKGKYHGPTVMIGNLEVVLNRDERTAKNALAQRWYWDGDVNNLVIEVPDEYSDGIVIDTIGQADTGPRSRIFQISTRNDIKNIKNERNTVVPAGTAVHDEDLVFTIVVGKNVKYVYIEELPTFVRTNDDGSATKYWVHIRFEVSPKNKEFYSEDGKLYDAGTHQLSSGIDKSMYPD